MFERLRWVMILVPAIVVGSIELLSDSVLDPYLPFPWDTLIITAVVLAMSFTLSTIAFRRIDALAGTLAARNAELERRIATARALHRVSVAIAALGDVEQMLTTIAGQARVLLRVDVAALLLSGPEGELQLAAGSGAKGMLDPTGGHPGEDALRFVDPSVAQSRLVAPLQRGDHTIGLLFVGSGTPRTFDVDDVETLASLANQAALALENARLQARLRELAVVEERERIAREMHDGLAQILGYVNTKSQAVESLLGAGRIAEARQQLAELAAAARSVYVDVREAILGLRSPISPETGLVGAIEAYAQRFAEASKLAVTVTASDAARGLELAPDVEAQAFRIVQESLTNVRKHAAARRVAIALALDGERFVIELEDDGRGLGATPASAGDWPSYGVQAMRERAVAAGGSIEWSATPTGGTIVRLTVPARATAPARQMASAG